MYAPQKQLFAPGLHTVSLGVSNTDVTKCQASAFLRKQPGGGVTCQRDRKVLVKTPLTPCTCAINPVGDCQSGNGDMHPSRLLLFIFT